MTTAEWRVNHEHHGLEIEFPGKPPQEIRTALKQNGFRWSRYSGVWYAKDCPHRREFLDTLATRGEDVEDPGLTFAEKMEAKRDRAEARQERLAERAERAQAEADSRDKAARTMLDIIPAGQPVLVGHHSEARHRRDLSRIDSNLRKSVEAQDKADYLAERATSTGATLRRYNNPAFLARRIKECETKIRKLQREKAKWEAERPKREAYLRWVADGGRERTDPGWDPDWWDLQAIGYTGDSDTNSWDPLIAEQQDKLDYCKAKLAELGGIRFSRENLRPGMRVMSRYGPATVKRANPKTVTLNYDDPHTNALELLSRCPYEDIRSIID